MGLSFDQQSSDHSTFPVSGGVFQRGDEPDQQRCSSAVLPKGIDHQRGCCRRCAPGSIRQPSHHNEEIKKQREKRDTPEGKLDKNGNLLKFSRDLDSDWIVKNNKPTMV